MNQNYQFLDTGSLPGTGKQQRSVQKPPLEQYGFTDRSWRCSLETVSVKSFFTAGLLLLLLFFNVWDGHSQVASYGFAAGTGGILDPMAGSVQLVGSASDDGNSGLTNIGFTFNYSGTNYTQFSAGANGLLRLGGTLATGSINYNNTATNAGTQSPAIMPYWDDLHTGTNGKVHYVLTGSAPNRILIIEWSVTVPRNTTGAAGAKFQCWLYETSNMIKFVYGNGMAVNSTNTGATIGLATSSTAFNTVAVATNTNSSTTFTTNNTAAIPAGTTYTFTTPPGCSGTPVAGTIAPASQTICLGSTPSTIVATGYSAAVPGISYQWEQSVNGAEWTNATGGSGATTGSYTPPAYAGITIQYRLNVTCANSTLNAVSNAATISPLGTPSIQVSAVTVSYNSTTASFTWTNGNGNRRLVIISNGTITDPADGSGPALTAAAAYSGSGQQIVYDGTSTSVTVTGLTPGTYNVKVYEYQRCGTTAPYAYSYNRTSGSNTVTVSNTCTAISSLPWTEGFEGVTPATTATGAAIGLPSCWTSGSSQWSSTSSTTYNSPRTGTKYIRYSYSSTNAYLWTRGFQLEAGVSYDFSFYAQGDGYTSWSNAVFVNTAANATGATQLTPAYSPAGPGSAVIQPYVKVTRSFTPSQSGVYYFAIRGNETTDEPWYMAFDDFELKLTPNCVSPGSLAIVSSNGTSADVSWTAPSLGTMPSGYEYAVTTSVTPPTAGTLTGGTSATGVAITPGVNYYLHVRSNCSEGEYSSWATSAPFKYIAGDTCATAISLAGLTSPYSSTTAVAGNDAIPACGSSFTTTAPDLYYYIDVPNNYKLNIGTTASGFDAASSLLYGTCGALTLISCSDNDTAARTWTNTTGSVKRVYWLEDGYSSASGTFTLAWTLVPPPACVPPSALTSVVTGTSAVVSWTASDSAPANGYQYELRTSGAAGSGATGLVTGATVTANQTNEMTGLTVGTTYTLYVRSLCGDAESSTWISKAFLVPPTNDLCANAITLSCGSSVTGSTNGGSNDNMAVCGITGVTTQNSAGVWYKYVSDGSDVTFSTCNPASGDTRLAIFTGACGTMTCVGGNEDNSACTGKTLTSEVVLSTTAGTTYYVLVYGFSSTASVNFEFHINCVAPCAPATGNDDCASAAQLTVGTALSSNNTCSTPSTGVAYPSCGSQFATYYDTWYTFNSGANTSLEVSLASAGTGTGFAVYSGTCGTFTQVGCNATGVATNVTLTANTNYFVRVYSNSAANRGNFTVMVKVPCVRPTAVTATAVTTTGATLSWTAPSSAPGNGYQYEVRSSGAAGSGATGLASSGSPTGVTTQATGLTPETLYSVYVRSVCGTGDNSPWTTAVTFTTLPTCYKPTAVTSASVTATGATISWTAPSQVPSNGYVWEVRTNGAAGSGATGLVATSSATGPTANLTSLTPSTTYTIYVRSNCGGSDRSSWTTGVTLRTRSANDACSGAIAVTCGSTVSGSVADATNENMAICGISGVVTQNTPGVWYKYVSDGSDVTFSTCSSTTDDTRMAVFTGACGTMSCVAGNDDNDDCLLDEYSSEVLISNTTAGTTYYVLVFIYSTLDGTNFELTTTCTPACAPAAGNDECAHAQLLQVGSTTATNNSCASASLGYTYPSCGNSFGTYYDTWYKFNSGANTSLQFSTVKTAPVVAGLAVYGGTCNALTQVGSCSTTGALTTVTGLTPYTVYYIRAFSTAQAARGAFSITIAIPCNAPSAVTSQTTSASTVISWAAATPAPQEGYQYEVRTSGAAGSGAAGLAANGTTSALSAALTGLTSNTTYSVYVRSACSTGSYSSWTAVHTFSRGYCVPAPTGVTGNGITNVTFDSVNNTTSDAATYADYTPLAGAAVRTEPLTVSVTFGTAHFAKIWVDWNGDLDFNDTGETVYAGTGAVTSATAAFNIPATAVLGNHRMRVGAGTDAALTACAAGADAAFEDYTINVTSNGAAYIRDNQCGAEIAGPNVDIFANFVPGNTMYRFRVTKGTNTQVIETANAYFKLSMLNNYAYGATYNVDVSVRVGGEWSDYGKVCRLTTKAVVPQTQLTDCGASVGFNTAIYAQSVSQATTYRFKVTSAAGTVVLDRPTNWFALSMLPSYSYSTAYTVSVDVLASGMWAGYGTACNITSLGQLPSTQLRTCGTTPSYSFGAPIYATTIAQAQVYRFTVTSIYGTETIDRNTDWFTLNMLSQYDYNTTYSVSVTVSAPGVTTSAAGTVCTVSSLATPPVTKLRTQDCGQTVSNKGVYIYANTVPGVATYRFEVTSTAGVYVLNRAVNYFKLSMIPNVNFGETVAVRVQTVSANGAASAYGDSCTVTLTNNGARQGEGTEANEGTTFKAALKGYPNPFTESFGLDLTTNSDEQVSIVVYDMLGKLVDKRIVNASQIPELRIGDNFAAGVYNLILTQGETVKTLRVVKNNN